MAENEQQKQMIAGQEVNPEFKIRGAYENMDALPTPVQKDDGTIQMDEISASDIFDAIITPGEDGYAACAIVAAIEKLHTDIHPTDEDPQKDREIVQTINLEYCTVSIYALTDKVWVVELAFDSKDDAYLVDLRDHLDRYRTMMMKLRQQGMKDPSFRATEIPLYTLTFVPYKFGGFGVASFGDPIDYYEVNRPDGKRGFHILFSPDSMSFEQVEMTRDEFADTQAEVEREEEEKQNMVYRSSY